MQDEIGQFAQILDDLRSGDASAADKLMPLVYDELRALANSAFVRQAPGHTLQPTAIVNEVYLKLAGRDGVRWESRAHFMAIAARAMRQILINHARDKATEKRGGDWQRITLDDAVLPEAAGGREVDLIALDDALSKLAMLSERQAQIVEMRFFGGLTIAETSCRLGVSTTTVENDWRMALVWLRREMKRTD